jgi:hypothetical protein
MAAPETLIFTESPLTAKQRFQFRPLSNWIFCGGVFVVVALALALAVPTPLVWIADGGVIAMLFYLNFFVLEKRPIKIRCPHCRKYIVTNTPWVCGACGKKNVRTDDFPFIFRCEHEDCGVEPAAYECHHRDCKKLIFLTEDERRTNIACCSDEKKERRGRDERAAKVRTDKEKIEDKANELGVADLDAKLKEIRAKSEGPKIKTLAEQKREAFDSGYDAAMGVRAHARKRRAEAAEEFKDDPESLKDANDAIDDLLHRFT